MADARKRPCCICRRWFRPDPRIGSRQQACRRPECQAARRKKKQRAWRQRNPDYFIARRIKDRSGSGGRSCPLDRKSTRLNSSHLVISYAVFCLKKKKIRRRSVKRGRRVIFAILCGSHTAIA